MFFSPPFTSALVVSAVLLGGAHLAVAPEPPAAAAAAEGVKSGAAIDFRSVRSSPRGDPATVPVFERVDLHVPGTTATALFIRDPARTLSVLAPPQGCGHAATVSESASAHGCLAAVNAGFFDRATGGCLGNLVSGGSVLSTAGESEFTCSLSIVESDAGSSSSSSSTSGTGNKAAKSSSGGNLTIGYVPSSVVTSPETMYMVSGVIWLVRDGVSAVDASAAVERPPHLDQPNLDNFVNIRAGRVAVGFTADGRAIVIKSDGVESDHVGLNLHELARVMIGLGAVQAVNLDGGGSSTMVIGGQLVGGAPQDKCPADHPFAQAGATCERNVTSILCVREVPELAPWSTCVSLPTLRSVMSEERGWKVVAIASATAALVLGMCIVAVRHHYQRKQSEAMYDYVFDQEPSEMLDILDEDDVNDMGGY